jgi:1,2-diacylglycerol 3-beta-galactosyltransferase
MIQGLPVVLSSFLPGQEAGNVPFVVDGGFGVYCGNKPKKIANEVSNLFNDEVRLEKMSTLARKLSKPEATRLIAKDIGDIAVRKTVELPVFKSSMQ